MTEKNNPIVALTAEQMIERAKKRQERKERRERLAKRPFQQRHITKNFFPFSPIRADRPNGLGLNLDKNDCRILQAISEGAKTIREICLKGHLRSSTVYERFKKNPDLREALRMWVSINFAIATPGVVSLLIEKAGQNAKFMELFLRATGMIEEPSFKLVQQFSPGFLSETEIQNLAKGGRLLS